MFSQVSSTVILCSWRTHPTSSIAKPSCMETIMKVHLKWFQLAEIWWGSSGMCWCASRDPIFLKARKTAAPFLPWHRSNGITAKAESAAPLLLAIIEPRLVVVAADLILSSSPLLRPIVRLLMLLVLLFLVPRDAQCGMLRLLPLMMLLKIVVTNCDTDWWSGDAGVLADGEGVSMMKMMRMKKMMRVLLVFGMWTDCWLKNGIPCVQRTGILVSAHVPVWLHKIKLEKRGLHISCTLVIQGSH